MGICCSSSAFFLNSSDVCRVCDSGCGEVARSVEEGSFAKMIGDTVRGVTTTGSDRLIFGVLVTNDAGALVWRGGTATTGVSGAGG